MKKSTINGLTDALAAKLTTPAGGTTGQVLTKTADSVTWSNPAGDMLKSEYDADDDGTVDNANLALFAQNVGTSPENSKSYSQVSSAVELMHEHSNMSVLNGIGVSSDQLTYNGSAVGGAPSWNNVTDKPDSFPPSTHTHAIADVTGLSDALEAAGTVKSVNGNNPNASGAVTIPTATTSAAGLMSASDKTKLNGLSTTAGTVTSVNGIEPDSAGAVTLYTRTVASNENVNSVDTPGTYYVDAGAGGLPSNDTAGGAYMMTVICYKPSGIVVQVLNALYNPNVLIMILPFYCLLCNLNTCLYNYFLRFCFIPFLFSNSILLCLLYIFIFLSYYIISYYCKQVFCTCNIGTLLCFSNVRA